MALAAKARHRNDARDFFNFNRIPVATWYSWDIGTYRLQAPKKNQTHCNNILYQYIHVVYYSASDCFLGPIPGGECDFQNPVYIQCGVVGLPIDGKNQSDI